MRVCPNCKQSALNLGAVLSATFLDRKVTCPNCQATLASRRGASRLGGVVPLIVYAVWSNNTKPDLPSDATALALATALGLGIAVYSKLDVVEKRALGDAK